MNKFNPQKLLHSKWTAVNPVQKEKHFLITELDYDEDGNVISCVIEAVISNRAKTIHWKELESEDNWVQGWK